MTDSGQTFTPPQGEKPKNSGGFDPQEILNGLQEAVQNFDPQAAINEWLKALTKPEETTYQEMISSESANMYTGIVWLLVGLIVQGFFAVFSTLIWSSTSSEYALVGGGSLIVVVLCVPFVTVLLLALYLGITYGVHYFATSQTTAELPTFVTWQRLFYVFSAIFAPLIIVGGVLSIIPFIGPFLAGLLILAGTGDRKSVV